MEEIFNDMASIEVMIPKPFSNYEEFINDNFYHDLFSRYKERELTSLERSTVEISHLWKETENKIDEHIAIIKFELEKFAEEKDDMFLRINSDKMSEFYRKGKDIYRFKSIYIHNYTFKVVLANGKSEKEAYLDLNEKIREQMEGFVLLNKALKDYYVSNRLTIPEWQKLYYSQIAIIFSLLDNFAFTVRDSSVIIKEVVPNIETFLSDIISNFDAPEDTIIQYELCRIFVRNAKNHMFLDVVENSEILNELKKEQIQNIIQYLSHYERNNTKYNDELKVKYNIKTNKDDNKEKYESFYNFMHSKLISEITTIAEALKSFEEMYEFNNNIGKSFTDSCNTSTTSDHFPDFVSSSTDDDYGKSTIRHFKSWDEECEGNDCAINDYEGGIKHFQD